MLRGYGAVIWGGAVRLERVGEWALGGLGTNGAPAVKEPSGSSYSVRGEQGDKERRGSLPGMKLLSQQL